MTIPARRTLARLTACRAHLERERHRVPGAHASHACAKLDHAIEVLTARLDAYDTAVVRACLVDTSRLWELRNEIRDALRPVITIARTALCQIPELAALRLPPTNASVGTLIGLLYQLADTVTRHRHAFEAEGLPPGTADRLRSLARRLNLAAGMREINRNGHRRLRREIAVTIRRGREAAKLLADLMADERSAESRAPFLRLVR